MLICFQSKQRYLPKEYAGGGGPCFLTSSDLERGHLHLPGQLVSCLCLDSAEDNGKVMSTCCLSLRGLVKPRGMEYSELFNLLGRKEFYEDDNMLSLIRENLLSTRG